MTFVSEQEYCLDAPELIPKNIKIDENEMQFCVCGELVFRLGLSAHYPYIMAMSMKHGFNYMFISLILFIQTYRSRRHDIFCDFLGSL